MLITLALLFAFLAMIGWGIGDFLIQKSVRKMGDVETLAFTGVLGGIILTPFVLGEIGVLFDPSGLILLAVLCVVELATALVAFEAYKKGKLSVTEVIIELELIVTVALGVLFFNEIPTTLQLILMGVVFLGLILVATKSFNHYKTMIERGAIIALFAALLMGAFNFLVSASARQFAPLVTIWISWLVTGVIALLIISSEKGLPIFKRNIFKYKWLILATAFFDMASWVFYALATSGANLGAITAITESYTVFGLVLGLTINKEKIAPHQLVGGVLAIIASVLLAMTLL